MGKVGVGLGLHGTATTVEATVARNIIVFESMVDVDSVRLVVWSECGITVERILIG